MLVLYIISISGSNIGNHTFHHEACNVISYLREVIVTANYKTLNGKIVGNISSLTVNIMWHLKI